MVLGMVMAMMMEMMVEMVELMMDMMVEMMMEMMVGWNQASLGADNTVVNDDCNGLIALAMKTIR